jgi:hypothetical protein
MLKKLKHKIANTEEKKRLDEIAEEKKRKIPETTQTRINVESGIAILKNIKKENDIEFEDTLDKILFSYLDRCAQDQLKCIIKFIPFLTKIDLFLEIINTTYQNKTADMKEGSTLYKYAKK